jgi:hypothetical protein
MMPADGFKSFARGLPNAAIGSHFANSVNELRDMAQRFEPHPLQLANQRAGLGLLKQRRPLHALLDEHATFLRRRGDDALYYSQDVQAHLSAGGRRPLFGDGPGEIGESQPAIIGNARAVCREIRAAKDEMGRRRTRLPGAAAQGDPDLARSGSVSTASRPK